MVLKKKKFFGIITDKPIQMARYMDVFISNNLSSENVNLRLSVHPSIGVWYFFISKTNDWKTKNYNRKLNDLLSVICNLYWTELVERVRLFISREIAKQNIVLVPTYSFRRRRARKFIRP